MTASRKPYPWDVTDDEWSPVVPYLTLMTEEAPQGAYPLCELFSGLRYVVRCSIAWRAMPNDLPPWSAVYQQTQRWLDVAAQSPSIADQL
jgi:transposase